MRFLYIYFQAELCLTTIHHTVYKQAHVLADEIKQYKLIYRIKKLRLLCDTPPPRAILKVFGINC